jgi:hypothetical protein
MSKCGKLAGSRLTAQSGNVTRISAAFAATKANSRRLKLGHLD